MARPPVEWPIPVYVAEFRERTLVVIRVPAATLVGKVQPPLYPLVSHGQAVMAMAFGSGRCLKSACGSRHLASEFSLTELLTPVAWYPACRAVVRGNWLISGSCSAPGIRRLCRAALGVDLDHDTELAECSVELERPVREAAWPATSFFESAEAAESRLLHPECCFVPDGEDEVVRAIPLHQYARSTISVDPRSCRLRGAARLLGLSETEIAVDHVLYQKRCTHTWAFPAERIPLAQFAAHRPQVGHGLTLARAA